MKNMGTIDRIIRTVLGLALVIAGVALQLTSGQFWWLAIPGVVFLFTASISICPIYMPFGISTLKKDK
ncbi:MAG: DUF2892 domain-containing protein [Spirochaetaceae bacterium]|jgi:glucose dehydrogenase|nr:DUF2892 domain-containing protein [Spirochaetaceae bacterium]